MNMNHPANPGPSSDDSMFLKTKGDGGNPDRQLCLESCNSVQVCTQHVDSRANFPFV
jgi:hypothetical protein